MSIKTEELKTLKDLKGYYESIISDRCVSMKELKAEAVKWVKNCECRRPYWGSKKCESCWRFINFFNLTEDDLKVTSDLKEGVGV